MFRLFLITLLLCYLPSITQAQVINIGTLSRSEHDECIPIALQSNDQKTLDLLHAAFSLHGGFNLVPNISQAYFTFQIQLISSQQAQLKIFSGIKQTLLFDQTFSGSNQNDAILRACDKAISKTLGIPGFFSGTIAFVGARNHNKEIYITDLFFQRVKQITRDHSDAVLPSWSKDGRTILFTSYFKTGYPDIFGIHIKTRQRFNIASYEGTNSGAVFNPKGNRLAMILSAHGNPEVYTSDPNGRNLKRLTHSKSIKSTPSWSPDGSEIVFTADFIGRPLLYKVKAQGGDLNKVPTNISGYCAEPDWNPIHAHLIAFTAAVNKGFQIALYNQKTKESLFLTSNTGNASHVEPCWLNDGRHLLVTERTTTYERICVLDSITQKITPIHNTQFGKASMPAFYYRQ